MKDVISEDVPEFGSTGVVTDENPGSSASAGTAIENSDVMVSEILVVGAVLFMWNKKRLKSGYIPGWDDEDDEK